MPMPSSAIVGATFGTLTIIADLGLVPRGSEGRRHHHVIVRCICGREFEVRYRSLTSGNTKGCGHKHDQIVGAVYGELTILEDLGMRPSPKQMKRWVLARCSCGTEFECLWDNVKRKLTQSCGRGHRRPETHGLTDSPEYWVWQQIIERCTNLEHPSYENYGGRGITVCDEWRTSFTAFYRDVGPRPSPYHTIERRDNDRGYEPGNCYWATRAKQARNKRNNVWIEFNGRRMVRTDWARELGLDPATLIWRLKRMSVEEALTRPVNEARRRRTSELQR